MFGCDHVLSTMRTFRPDRVLCARTGDLGRTWPASVLENSAPASECQRSDVWGLELRWLLWVACSSLGGSMALLGLGLRWALSLSPCQVPPPWGMEAPQVGYLVIIPIFQYIQVE